MPSFIRRSLLLLFLFGTTSCTPSPRSLTVSAAANLQTAFAEIGEQYTRQTGTPLSFNFGSTGQLAQQITQGAPVDLFASADRQTIDDLAARGLVLPDSVQVYARGQIVLYARAGLPIILRSLADLSQPEVKRIAIANPDRAPYGRAARQALQNAKVWSGVESRLVISENIQQTLQYAETGNVDAAIVALSLVHGSSNAITPIPPDLYDPIDQALAIIKGTPNERTARSFAAFVTGAQGRTILSKYGYDSPPAK